MTNFYFNIHDNGTYWIITGGSIDTSNKSLDPTMYCLVANLQDFNYIFNLLKTNIIKVSKEFLGFDGAVLNIENIIIEKIDPLTALKIACETKARMQLQTRLTFVEIFDILSYININNMLIDKGFVITDDNREEKYLDIINTGDDLIISLLEQYLNIKDKLSYLNYYYQKYNEFKIINDLSTTEEELKNNLNNFLQLFS